MLLVDSIENLNVFHFAKFSNNSTKFVCSSAHSNLEKQISTNIQCKIVAKGISAWIIALICILSVLTICLIGAGVYFMYKKHKIPENAEAAEEDSGGRYLHVEYERDSV